MDSYFIDEVREFLRDYMEKVPDGLRSVAYCDYEKKIVAHQVLEAAYGRSRNDNVNRLKAAKKELKDFFMIYDWQFDIEKGSRDIPLAFLRFNTAFESGKFSLIVPKVNRNKDFVLKILDRYDYFLADEIQFTDTI